MHTAQQEMLCRTFIKEMEANEMPGCDMLVNLYTLPKEPEPAEGILIKRAWAGDMETILSFVREQFSAGWAHEVQKALMQLPSTCFLATKNGELVGFACYDTTARGYFGPIGVLESMRGKNIGKTLLLHTLHAMKAAGYGYGIIGWVDDARLFYEKAVGAVMIPGGDPDHSVYQNRISFQ